MIKDPRIFVNKHKFHLLPIKIGMEVVSTGSCAVVGAEHEDID